MRGHSSSTPRSAARAAVTGALALALAAGLSPMGPPLARPGPAAATTGVQRAAVNVASLTPTRTLATLSLDQRVGQVLMMGVPATGASATDLSILTKNKIGNVFLKGHSHSGVTATKAVVTKINATVSLTSTGGQKRFIATDQEGGYVQVLKGPGFSTMPTALHQGTWAPSTLKAAATTWGKQLHAAGLNVNLAPVADTVPSAAFAPYNLPRAKVDAAALEVLQTRAGQ
ncbi:glycoside hydrolase family 3 N-terminal domain-containing protein [Paeniglutamicibacter psychrophenolicus]|uniref:glycoside hydrolase family 3 N-terminal domain-containing protein n=1 Tax=Paeniglutamicibacter psychrophenolicus TaxID=257454 RepID=UPI00278A7241|nr:glycoside hydrolase family 3 N-terminal domain-containing protein [Paeniglutamicibacter psychrophenolicus]MDQ0093190.1 hypothetical protein [Paeniglutamicibacter psychrophenolicus]